jgi:hypothetical protein
MKQSLRFVLIEMFQCHQKVARYFKSVPNFMCNGSVTVAGDSFFNCNVTVTG